MATTAMLLRPYVLVAATRLCSLPISSSFRPRIVSAAIIGSMPKRLQLGNGYLTKSRSLMVDGNGLRFSTSATNVNSPGSIDSPLMESMQKKIKEELSAESVSVKDAYGDGRHVSIDVISSAFEGQSAVNRQRMVYKAIWEELQNTVHAVDQMTTRTPSEAGIEK